MVRQHHPREHCGWCSLCKREPAPGPYALDGVFFEVDGEPLTDERGKDVRPFGFVCLDCARRIGELAR